MHQYDWLDAYLLGKPGVEKDFKEEWQWWRYQIRGKLFAAILCPGEQYDPLYAGKDLLTLKCDPMLAGLYREQHPEVLPGFYMEKSRWNSVDLGGKLPDYLLREMCDHSYEQVLRKLPKRVQRDIEEEVAKADGGASS